MKVTPTSLDGVVYPRDAYGLHFTVADFDIGGTSLKTNHRVWLKQLVSIIRSKGTDPTKYSWTLELTGRASQTDDEETNMALSQGRMNEVQSFLEPRLKGYPVRFSPLALGETAPHDLKDKENDMDRSVDVEAVLKPSPWRVIDEPKIKPAATKKFDLKLTAAKLSALRVPAGRVPLPVGFAWVVLNFTIEGIYDETPAQYYFEGEGPVTGCQPAGPAVWRGLKRYEFEADRSYHKRSFGGYGRLSDYFSKEPRFQIGGHRTRDWPRATVPNVDLPYPLIMFPKIATFDLTGTVRMGVGRIDEPLYEFK